MNLPTLVTERLLIRPLSVFDAEDMFEYAKTTLVGPSAGWQPHNNISETISIIKAMMTIKGPNDLGNWAIVWRQSGKMIGTIELYNHIPQFKAELGYALNPNFWGRGLIPEACQEVLRFGFEYLQLKRIEVHVFVDNYQSQRVCEKLGFIKEGIARNGYLSHDGRLYDELCYGMTNQEFHNQYH